MTGLLIPGRKGCTECTGIMVLDEYHMEYVCDKCGLVEEVVGVQCYGKDKGLALGIPSLTEDECVDDPDDEEQWRN